MNANDHRRYALRRCAQGMARKPYPEEKALWPWLKRPEFGYSVRMQWPLLGQYIVDFYVHEPRLCIEIDGAYHRRIRLKDRARDERLSQFGYHMLRIKSQRMRESPEAVAQEIQRVARTLMENQLKKITGT